MPHHGHFAVVVIDIIDIIERRIIIPGAIVQGITGVALIVAIGLDITSPAWCGLGTARLHDAGASGERTRIRDGPVSAPCGRSVRGRRS